MESSQFPFLIQVSSPNPIKYKKVQKYRFNRTYWMPPWDYEEIINLSKINTTPRDIVDHQYSHYGGIPRYIFDLPDLGYDPLINAIKVINVQKMITFIGESLTLNSAEHILLHNIPNSNYMGHTINFGSDYIKKEVLKKIITDQRRSVIESLDLDYFLHSALGGVFFEECSHHTLQNGGVFEIVPLHITVSIENTPNICYLEKNQKLKIDELLLPKKSNTFTYVFGNKFPVLQEKNQKGSRNIEVFVDINCIPKQITIPPSSKNSYATITHRFKDFNTVKVKEYSVPYLKTQACIDAIYKISPNRIIFFQITVNKHPNIRYAPFFHLIQQFPMDSVIELLWVVPSKRFQKFAFQGFLDENDHIMDFNSIDDRVKKVNQYVLHMSRFKLREILYEEQPTNLIHKKLKLDPNK